MAGADVFWIFMLDYEVNWGIRKHTHDFYQLYYIVSGEGEMILGDGVVRLSSGLVVLIHPGQEHELFPIKEGALRMIDVKFYVREAELDSELRGIPQTQYQDHEFYKLLYQVRGEWKSALPYKKVMADLLLTQCLYTLVREHAKSEESKQLFPELEAQLGAKLELERLGGLPLLIANYVREHCFTHLSLDGMAAALTYNRNYLCKVFKQATGMTIIGYANYLRIFKAVEIIRYSNEKISDVCERVGFHDIHYFSRVFKKITGHTPGELRDSQKYDIYTDIVEHGTFSYRYKNDPGDGVG